jgi:putative flippase GtrA
MSKTPLLHYPASVLRDLQELVRDIRQQGFQKALAEVMRPDAPGTWQLIKYLVIGVMSVVIFMGVCALFRLLAIHVLGASYSTHRAFWNLLEIAVGFIPTNAFTYATNRRWVFVAGKHHSQKEFFLFTAAALLSVIAAELCAYVFITHSSIGDFLIKIAVIVVSTVVNFTFRKMIVFHR